MCRGLLVRFVVVVVERNGHPRVEQLRAPSFPPRRSSDLPAWGGSGATRASPTPPPTRCCRRATSWWSPVRAGSARPSPACPDRTAWHTRTVSSSAWSAVLHRIDAPASLAGVAPGVPARLRHHERVLEG